MKYNNVRPIYSEYEEALRKASQVAAMVYGVWNDERIPQIVKVIFNAPATIIFWSDRTKTVVKAHNEAFDKEKGLSMAIAKKAMGNRGNYFNEIKKWTKNVETKRAIEANKQTYNSLVYQLENNVYDNDNDRWK